MTPPYNPIQTNTKAHIHFYFIHACRNWKSRVWYIHPKKTIRFLPSHRRRSVRSFGAIAIPYWGNKFILSMLMAETWNSSSPREGQHFSQIDTNGIGFPVTNMWYFGGNVRKLRSIFLYRSDSKSSNIFRGSLPKIPKRGQLLGGINAKEPAAIDWAWKAFPFAFVQTQKIYHRHRHEYWSAWVPISLRVASSVESRINLHYLLLTWSPNVALVWYIPHILNLHQSKRRNVYL